MKKVLASAIGVLLICAASLQAAVEMPASSYTKGLSWLGHASFKLVRGNVTVYFDPWRLSGSPQDADLVLITHPHFDHLEPADLNKVLKPDTVIVTVQECADKLKEAGVSASVQVVKPGDKINVKGVLIEAVAAYNLGKVYHPKEKQWVGFVIELDGTRIYHAGDTDFIPEMKEIKTDVALLPVSGTYVMTADEAADAAKAISAKVIVPMHYGTIIGTEVDAKKLQEICSEMVVEVMVKEEGSKK